MRALLLLTLLSMTAALLASGGLSSASASELPYRQMALTALYCQKITNMRRKKACLWHAKAPIRAVCQKQRGQSRTTCYRRQDAKLRAAMTQEIRRRRKN